MFIFIVCKPFLSVETYSALLKKAHHDTAKLPIICTPITGPTGEMVFRIDDIIGEVSVIFLCSLFSFLSTQQMLFLVLIMFDIVFSRTDFKHN